MVQQIILQEGAFNQTQRDQINQNFSELFTLNGLTPGVTSTTSWATPTPNADTDDLYIILALAEAAVISDTSIASFAHITADVDSTTGGKGLMVCLVGYY